LTKSIAGRIWQSSFLRFLLIGAVNTVFGYSVFYLISYFGIYYSIALLIATLAGIVFNFFTTGRIVFLNTRISLLPKFVLVYIFTYVVNVTCISILKQYIQEVYIIQAILAIPMAVLSFTLNRIFVFVRNSNNGGASGVA